MTSHASHCMYNRNTPYGCQHWLAECAEHLWHACMPTNKSNNIRLLMNNFEHIIPYHNYQTHLLHQCDTYITNCVCLHVCLHMCAVCVHVCVHMFAVCLHVCCSVFACVFAVCVHVCVHVCICVQCVCMCVCICVHLGCVCLHMCAVCVHVCAYVCSVCACMLHTCACMLVGKLTPHIPLSNQENNPCTGQSALSIPKSGKHCSQLYCRAAWAHNHCVSKLASLNC